MEQDLFVVQNADNYQAIQTREALKKAHSQGEDSFFDTCDLLLKASQEGHHLQFGWMRFSDYVGHLGIDLSGRNISHYITIADRVKRLQLDRSTMKQVKVSKLREILSLDPEKFSSEMRELLKVAPAMSVEEVKGRVKSLKTGAGYEEMVYMTIKYPASAKEVIDSAFEKVRQVNGNYVVNGEVVELPNGKVLEYLSQEYLNQPVQES